jgi:tetratricopeptide (TPR) repeat protein
MSSTSFKPRFLDLLRWSQTSQNAFFAQFPAEELGMSGTPDLWSAKDHVAHMSFWRRRLVARVQAAVEEQPQPQGVDFEDMNPVIFAQNHDRLWPDILAESDQVYADLIRQTERVSEDDLTIADRFDWAPKGTPLYLLYMGNSFDHAANHLSQYAADRGDLERAISTYAEWASHVTDPEMPGTLRGFALYNLACFYATHGRLEPARPALRESFQLYPDGREIAKNDPDLDALRPLEF